MDQQPKFPATDRRGVRLVVGGAVQGVGFRYFVHRAAQTRGVAGYVRNLPDGDVEIVAEGPARSLESFIGEVRAGPRFARVQRMDRQECEATGSFNGFEIRR
jgi:acylphosphatase